MTIRSARLAAAWLVVLFLPALVSAQEVRDIALSGVVRDAQTGEVLIGANVFVEELGAGAATGALGTYRLMLPRGTHEVRYSFVGYETEVRTLNLEHFLVVDVALQPTIALEGVEVTALPPIHELPELGVSTIKMSDLQRLPSLMGEVDVTRGLLLLPGVTSVGEGSGGFNVRGGNVDQNLMLFDGTQVFFSSHLFGMFSAFNPELVDQVTLYRGTVPARLGGRVSSIVDVRQRDGRADRLGVRGTAGMMTSQIAVEGPLFGSEDARAIVAARRSHANWFINLVDRPELRNSQAAYGDVGGRLSIRASSRLRGGISGYWGMDDFSLGNDTTYFYGTGNLAVRSTYVVSPRVSTSFDAAHSRYNYTIDSQNIRYGFDYAAEVFHQQFQATTVWAPDWATLEAGAALNHYRLRPGKYRPTGGLNPDFRRVELGTERGQELAGFASADFVQGDWRFETGLRYGLWQTLGPAEVPIIDPELPLGQTAVVGTERVPRGEVVASYGGLEPRLALRYSLSDDASVKAGYSRMRQNIHLLTNTTAPTPMDRWKLSDRHVRPQVGDQVMAGVFGDLGRGVSGSLEAYYRWLYDVPAYRNGAQLMLGKHAAAELLEGDGRAYGLELYLEKPEGMLTGWLSYTLSRAERRAFATRPSEQVNGGSFYPADADRPHDLSLSLMYNESTWATWGLNFVYSSGRAITFPDGAFDVGDVVVPSYSERNQARVPPYHRLDVSLTVHAPAVPTGRYRGRWTFAIYNLYARKNAYSIFFSQRPGTNIPQAYRLSTIGTVLPSISYTFEF